MANLEANFLELEQQILAAGIDPKKFGRWLLMRQSSFRVVPMPHDIYLPAFGRLLYAAFGLKGQRADLRPIEREYLSVAESGRWFEDFAKKLDERSVSVIVTVFGLHGRGARTHRETCIALGLTPTDSNISLVSRIKSQSLWKLRCQAKAAYVQRIVDTTEISVLACDINDMHLPRYIVEALQAADMWDVHELITEFHTHVLAYFSPDARREIELALSEFGLLLPE